MIQVSSNCTLGLSRFPGCIMHNKDTFSCSCHVRLKSQKVNPDLAATCDAIHKIAKNRLCKSMLVLLSISSWPRLQYDRVINEHRNKINISS